MPLTTVTSMCPFCRAPFDHPPSTRRIYCSFACRNRAGAEPLETRFWKHVHKTKSCWIWTGARTQRGRYGVIINESLKKEVVHRVSWRLHFGPIPDSKEVCHNCPGGDDPACVRPDHLWLGSHLENMQDARRKGWQPWKWR